MNNQSSSQNLLWLPILLSVLILLACIIIAIVAANMMQDKTFVTTSKIGDMSMTAYAASDSDTDAAAEGSSGGAKDLKSVISENQQRVVLIVADGYEGEMFGSGFLYNERGDIVTNAHVVEGADTVTVKMADSTYYEGTVIGIGGETDIALVRVPELAGTKPMKIKRAKAEVGDEVIAFGSPLGLENTVTTGIISGVDRDFDLDPYMYEDAYQISAPIAPGNSGGPLVSKETGEVIGINSAGADQGSIGFSIPIVDVKPMLDSWANSY